ncbi:MAG: sigma-70 family RNA polymerase sigma factor [Caldimonas sp.]
MSEDGANPASIIATLEDGRRRFLALVADVRPDLHRYCARMTGSVSDGEDVVQDTLARAYYQLPELKELPPLRPWLFRIAHNRAIDHLRGAAHRRTETLDAAEDIAADGQNEPESALARSQAVHAAVASFLELAPTQRACVIMKDVLDHTLEEIADELELSVPAVKAALHRGRARLLEPGAAAAPAGTKARTAAPEVARYASLFNAHDWDGVRSMLADDVKLDLVSRRKATGRHEVGLYFGNYERQRGWHLAPAWLDGREVLAVTSEPQHGARSVYFVVLTLRDGRIQAIRDYRYVPYIANDAALEAADRDRDNTVS